MKVKLLLTFALLLTAVTGAWADFTPRDGDEWDDATKTLTVNSNPGESAYLGNTEIQHLVIASGVTSIGDQAFEGCSGLTTVTIGSGVTYIGRDAFYDCTKVEVVYCNADPAKLRWDESGCDDFKEDGTTIINVADAAPWIAKFTGKVNGTFIDTPYVPLTWNYDAATKTLTFSGTMIPSYGNPEERPWKDYVEVVEKIVISDGVTSIGSGAFYNCTGLTTVTIGTGVTYIGSDAFFNCKNVEVVYCKADPEELTWDESGCDDFKPDGTTIIQVADAAPWIAKFTGVVNGIFSDKPYVPLSWNYDADTKTLTFSGTVIPSYGDPDERPWIAYVAEVENIVIEDDVTSIGNYAFYDCDGLTTVTIGSGVTYIGMDVFYDCKNVEVVYCNADPEKLTWEESCCDDFKEDGTTIIQVADAAPWIAKFTGVVNGIFSDKPYVPLSWNYDADTKTLTFSGTMIPSYNDLDERPWKDYVSEVENIVINEGVRGIGNYAFYGCDGLTTVTIPASVTSIGRDAFYDCTGLTTVTIPASVTSIGYGVFGYCSNLATMTVEAGNTVYDSRNNCNAIIEKETNTLIAGCKNTIIPDDVTDIDDNAFEGCISLTTVTIPASVTSIGRDAFYDCTGLTTVTIPASVTSIGYGVFGYCSNLATMTVEAGNTVYDSRNNCNAIIEKETNTLIAGCKNTIIPDDVTDIDDNAFEGCISLTTVTIPAGVTRIGDLAFQNCTGLTTVTIGSGVTFIGVDAFYQCTAVTDIYCYADPDALTWDEGGCDDFKDGKATKCHVTDAAPWSAFTDVNVDFVGDLAPEAATNEAGEEYWSSYYNSAAHLKADDNTTVYKATLSGTTVTLTEITDKVITAGQAVLLKKTTNDPVELTPWADASEDDYSDNDLEGVDAETAKESGSDYYVLSYQASKLSFYKYSGATLGANKAFFKIPANSSREFLDILGEVTGIDGRCKMEDVRSDVYYDLNGRRVLNPTKGIYIVNGNKVVIK